MHGVGVVDMDVFRELAHFELVERDVETCEQFLERQLLILGRRGSDQRVEFGQQPGGVDTILASGLDEFVLHGLGLTDDSRTEDTGTLYQSDLGNDGLDERRGLHRYFPFNEVFASAPFKKVFFLLFWVFGNFILKQHMTAVRVEWPAAHRIGEIMSLKERMAQNRLRNEQKRAERQLVKMGKSGEAVVASIRADRSPVNLGDIEKIAGIFTDAEKKDIVDKLLDTPRFKAMYAMVKEYLTGDWSADFRRLLNSVPPARRLQAQAISWEDWQQYGKEAALDERGLLQAIQVIVIFRKSLDRNQVSKPKMR